MAFLVRLHDLDGTIHRKSYPSQPPGVLSYHGALYQRQYVGSHDYYYVVFVPPSITGGGDATRAHNGWNDLRRAMIRRLPTALARSHGYLHAADRNLRRLRGVR